LSPLVPDERPAEDRSNEPLELSPLETCMQLSLFGGTLVRLADNGTPGPLEDERLRAAHKSPSPWTAEASGFNVRSCELPACSTPWVASESMSRGCTVTPLPYRAGTARALSSLVT
jgi:hypothetical protein